ncbi:MAG: hypothetical protein NVS3B10_04640 [Polyangiales bacterium]
MSWTWLVYAPLPQAELLAIADAFHEAVAAFLEQHPDCDDEFGEVDAGGPVPKVADVESFLAAHPGSAAPSAPTLARLATCRSALAIDPVPRDATRSPLQVSALQFLLEAIGPCVFDWGERRLALSESVLAELAGQTNRGRLLAVDEDADEDADAEDDEDDDLEEDEEDAGVEEDDDAPSSARALQDPSTARGARCIELLRGAIEDVERSVDAQRALRRQSETARGYAALLLEEGPLTDPAAARALGVTDAELTTAAAALLTALEALDE